MRSLWTWIGVICLSTILPVIWIAGCSREASFNPPFDLNTSERFRSETFLCTESDWSNRGQSAGSGWSSQRLVVANWEGYLSRSFIRFTAFPDSSVDVDSVLLYLYTARVEGEAHGTTFDVHVLIDTLKQLEIYWNEMPAVDATPLTSFEVPHELGDSIIVDVTDAVVPWIKGESPSLGFAIKTDEDPGASQLIVEFASRNVLPTVLDDTTTLDRRPALRIAYVDTAGEEQRAVSVAAEDVFADTLTVPFPPDTLSLLCGSGFPSRSLIRFDISEIPDGSTVTRSVLRLFPDLEGSSFDSLDVICHAALDATWSGFDTRIGASGTGRLTLRPDELASGEPVEMVITPLIQPMAAGTQRNYGLVVKSAGETSDLDFIRFFSSSYPDTQLIPRIDIDYVLPPEPPYSEEQTP